MKIKRKQKIFVWKMVICTPWNRWPIKNDANVVNRIAILLNSALFVWSSPRPFFFLDIRNRWYAIFAFQRYLLQSLVLSWSIRIIFYVYFIFPNSVNRFTGASQVRLFSWLYSSRCFFVKWWTKWSSLSFSFWRFWNILSFTL